MTRRSLLAATGAFGAAALAGPAFAQNAIDDFLRNTKRGGLTNSFDGTAVAGGGSNSIPNVTTSMPVFSQQVVGHLVGAIEEYRGIVARGGWPIVPADQKLRVGVVHPNVSVLRRRLFISGDLPQSAGASDSFDTFVDQGLKRFQQRHGMPADGVAGPYTFAALNISAPVRLGQLETNLVRLRSMSGFLGNRYVMVNVPAQEIEVVEGERVSSRHAAVVGKIDRQTPILNSKIHEMNINPYWTAPVSIVRKDIIPLMRKNAQYLVENKIRVFDGQTEIDPVTIDWNTEEAVNYRFRQDPSKINAMGSVKINFPNPHAVYMHDTPQQSLFSKLLRFESSGCVRVANVRDMMVWLARDTPGWDRRTIERTIESGDRVDIDLVEPVPVYFTYISAWSTGPGVVQFRDDIYQRDGVSELNIGTNI
ncbi:MAG: L,D-transpeptidase family protein [Pseudomonadota bacterium]